MTELDWQVWPHGPNLHEAHQSEAHFKAWLGKILVGISPKRISTIRKQNWYMRWKNLLSYQMRTAEKFTIEEGMRWIPIIYSQLDTNRAFRSHTTACAAERSLALAWVDTFPDISWAPSELLGL